MLGSGKQDAVKLLSEDHRTVETLFKQFQKAEEAEKEGIARRICTELKVHAMLEEEILYPALRGKIDDADLDEAMVEHDGAKLLINEIEAGGAEADFFEAKVKVLQEQIEHHVKEEEKEWGSLFAQARKADVDLQALGQRIAARKAELMEQAESEGLPAAQTSTMETQ
jgi:hemerythrin superfamily protein